MALSDQDYVQIVEHLAELGVVGGVVYDALILRSALNAQVDQVVTLNEKDFRRAYPEFLMTRSLRRSRRRWLRLACAVDQDKADSVKDYGETGGEGVRNKESANNIRALFCLLRQPQLFQYLSCRL